LELQLHQEDYDDDYDCHYDYDYELQCRDLLKHIYQNTLETQQISRELKDAATPRVSDEYE
jgi:hypothetical protein